MRKIFGVSGTHPIAKRSDKLQESEKELRGQQFKVNGRRYVVEHRIAEGGFAIVYCVRCHSTGKLLALKRQFVNESKQLEACKREIHIIQTLSGHKNIVRYVDHSIVFHEAEGVHEYLLLTKFYRNNVLQGMNECLAMGKYFSEVEILHIFCDIVEAVSRLHHCQTSVIHRDLKVENILIDDDNTYVLCDFGSATTRVYSTETHNINAVEEEITKYTTLSYRSPEMVDIYSRKAITVKSDIWALGVMLYKLCFFTLPFGESPLAIQNCTYSFPDSPTYSSGLISLIKYMLQPNCDLRPDIYQVASVAFRLSNRKNPVGNLNNVRSPTLSDMKLYPFRAPDTTGINSANLSVSLVNQQLVSPCPPEHNAATTTTVTPRSRPKGCGNTTVSLPLAGGLQSAAWKQQKENAIITAQCTNNMSITASVSNPDIRCSNSVTSECLSRASNMNTPVNSSFVPSHSVHGLSSKLDDIITVSQRAPNALASQEQKLGTRSPLFAPIEAEESFHQGCDSQFGLPGNNAATEPNNDPLQFARQVSATQASSHSNHRRNVSDTSAVNIGACSGRPSAFRPYQSCGATNTVDTGSPKQLSTGNYGGENSSRVQVLCGGGGVYLTGSEADVDADVAATAFSVSSSLIDSKQYRALSNPELPFLNDQLNPIAPAALVAKPSLTSTTAVLSPEGSVQYTFRDAVMVMDDTRFGDEFDGLPRRRDSISSTKNVKSRESLVMDETDPFGSAPFVLPTRSKGRSHANKTDQRAGSLTRHNTAFLDVPSSSMRRSRKQQQTSSSQAADPNRSLIEFEAVALAADQQQQQPVLSSIASNLKPNLSTKYKKLVDTDDEAENPSGSGGSQMYVVNPSALSNHAMKPVQQHLQDDETDSVGSASDLQQRIQMMATSDDEESDDRVQHSKAEEVISDDSSFDDSCRGSEDNIAYEQSGSAVLQYPDYAGYQSFIGGGGTGGSSGAASAYELEVSSNGAVVTQDAALYPNNDSTFELLGEKPLLDDMDDVDIEQQQQLTSSLNHHSSKDPPSKYMLHRGASDALELNVFLPPTLAGGDAVRKPVELAYTTAAAATAVSPIFSDSSTPIADGNNSFAASSKQQQPMQLPVREHQQQRSANASSAAVVERSSTASSLTSNSSSRTSVGAGVMMNSNAAGGMYNAQSTVSVPSVESLNSRGSGTDAFGLTPFQGVSLNNAVATSGATRTNSLSKATCNSSVLPSPPASRGSRGSRASPVVVLTKSSAVIGSNRSRDDSSSLSGAATQDQQHPQAFPNHHVVGAVGAAGKQLSSTKRTAVPAAYFPVTAASERVSLRTSTTNAATTKLSSTAVNLVVLPQDLTGSDTTTSDEETSFGSKSCSRNPKLSGKSVLSSVGGGSLGRAKKVKASKDKQEREFSEDLTTPSRSKHQSKAKRKEDSIHESSFVNTSFQNEDVESDGHSVHSHGHNVTDSKQQRIKVCPFKDNHRGSVTGIMPSSRS